jgi:hypothetical protein
VPLAVGALAVFSGCSGNTTGASDITLQSDGTYSAKLNVVGSCDQGSPSTPCTGYTRWRKIGARGWINGPALIVKKKLSDVHRSQTATGLAPETTYEYQVCGKEFAQKSVTCVGSNGPKSADPFVTGAPLVVGPQTPIQAAVGHTPKQAATSNGAETNGPPSTTQSPTQPGSPTVASEPTNGSSQRSSSGEAGGSSPLMPAAIALALGGLVFGGIWWASKRFRF